MESKVRRGIVIAATLFPSLLVALSAFMKLSGAEVIVQGFTELGVVQFITVLGVMELAFAALFVFPKTFRIGFVLLSCYFAGAMATELSHGMPPVSPAIVLVIIWIAAWVRDKSVFIKLDLHSIADP